MKNLSNLIGNKLMRFLKPHGFNRNYFHQHILSRCFACFILSLFFNSCIDKVELKEPNVGRKLIVDGTVTNLPGPYIVQLSYSVPFNSKKLTDLTNGADITISDNLGNIYPLKSFNSGIYKTDSATFRGIVGRTYIVKIKTLDSKQYQSKLELLREPVPLDTVTSTYAPSEYSKGFDVFATVKDPSVSSNYYRWKWLNYEELDTCYIKSVKNDQGRFVVRSLCCEPCWQITSSFGSLALFSDDLINGNTFTQKIANIPYNSVYDYYMRIEQYSISKENYTYWNLVQGQISNSGGIFDNTPAFIQGNVFNVKDSTEQVLGNFNVMGAYKKITFIKRTVLERPTIPTPLSGIIITTKECEPCKGDSRTPVKPEGWKY
jgi:Domain of unknown function (DUF4249)